MKLRKLPAFVAALAMVTWFLPPQWAQAEGPATNGSRLPPTVVRDVVLGAGGQLSGQAVNGQGRPLASYEVAVFQAGKQVAAATTDAQGHFAVDSLKGGLYQIAGAEKIYICRCWTPETAPPAANREILVVGGEGVTRGQRPMVDLLRDPLMIGLIIAAAVAIPIIIHNSKNDRATGS